MRWYQLSNNKKTILLDFDGVLASYTGWKGEGVLGEPIPKAREACWILNKYFKLVCFTTRRADDVKPWLKLHGFPIDHVTNLKVPAFLQVDDRSLLFQGEWTDDLVAAIKDFKPWWQGGEES